MTHLYLDMFPDDPHAVPGRGALNPRYALVGTAPSKASASKGQPFGSSSYRFLSRFELWNEPLYLTNLIKAPLNEKGKINIETIRDSYPFLIRELKSIGVSHRVICFGTAAAQALCPGFTKMREDHGTFFWNPDLGLWVVPTHEFSAISYDPFAADDIARDLERFTTLPDPRNPAYRVLDNARLEDELYDLLILDRPGKEVAIDIETTGLDLLKDTITAVGLMDVDSDLVLEILDPGPRELEILMKYLRKHKATLVGHNLQFDLPRLSRHSGVTWMLPVRDSILYAHTQGENRLSLKHLTTFYTDRPGSRAFGSWDSPGYLAEDIYSTAALWHKFKTPEPVPALELTSELVPYFSAMQNRGVFIDLDRMAELRQVFQAEGVAQHDRLVETAASYGIPEDLNWGAPAQVGPALVKAGVPLTKKTKTGAISVAEDELLPHRESHELVDALLTYREKLKHDSFLENYQEATSPQHPYLHSSILLFTTDTGRTSSRNPNLQQVPREGPIKEIFIPRWKDGLYALCDLSQAELRVAAMLSGDVAMAEALMSGDAHTQIAAKVFNLPPDQVPADLRKKSKGVTFGLLYGGSPEGLAKRTGGSVQEVTGVLHDFFQSFPDLSKWIEEEKRKAVETGLTRTPTGRVRDLSGVLRMDGAKAVERRAVNTPIQSLASDVMLTVVRNTCRGIFKNKLKSRPLFTVHDSMLIEVWPGEVEALAATIEEAFLSIPVDPLGSLELARQLPIVGEMKVGRSWAAVESTNGGYDPVAGFDFSSLEGASSHD